MNYVGQCGSCVNFLDKNCRDPYDNSNASYVKGYCTCYSSFYYPDDHCDSHYHSKSDSSSGCYITTMICDILGYEDTCDSLETLRSFRNNVLQKDPKYAGLLYEYDTVGPKIAKELKKEDKDFVLDLYEGFIVPIVSDIKEKRNHEAVSRYVFMTKALEETYGISFEKKAPLTYDYQKGGHGVCKKKTYKLAI